MSFYTYAGEEDTCEECGKTFTHAPEYAYKAFFKKGKTYKLYYFCSWKCLQKYRRGEQHGEHGEGEYVEKKIRNHIKLDMNKAREIRKLYADGAETQEEIAEKYGVSQKAVSNIITGRAWRE